MPEKFEQQFFGNKEKYAEVSSERQPAEQELDFIIEKTRSKRPDLEEFTDRYGNDVIAKDRAAVEALEKKFDAELKALPESERALRRISKKRGEALEIVISEQTELSDWFGPNAMTERTTKYDDYKNKVDLIVEFNPESEEKQIAENDVKRLALAIDVSDDPVRFADKMQVNKDKIMGRLPSARVKYFQSQVTDYQGPLNKVVPVVIGLEGKNIQNLLHLENKSLRGIDLKMVNNLLANHPAQRVFIEEILAQLEWYKKLSEKEGANLSSAYQREDLENLSGAMKELLKEKKVIDLDELEEDRVMQKIKKIVK